MRQHRFVLFTWTLVCGDYSTSLPMGNVLAVT